MSRLPSLSVAACFGAALALAGCAGGGSPSIPTGSQAYTSTAAPRHSYTPHDWYSHVSRWERGEDPGQVFIGGDLEPREPLRHVSTRDGIRLFMGPSRDGVGVARIAGYEHDLLTSDETDPHNFQENGFYPFIEQPFLYLDEDLFDSGNEAILQAVDDSVALINDALPPEYQVSWQGADDVSEAFDGEIVVRLETPAAIGHLCGPGAVACAQNIIDTVGEYTVSSVLYIPDDFDADEYQFSRGVIVHELLHALGIWGHVDSVQFPDSIMGAAGEYIPNLGHIVSRIDREVLQIMYMSQRSDLYNDWGEWSDTSFHLMGETADSAMRFGVALFNGLPQPWMRGTLPDTALADSGLTGTATWNGSLLAYSGPSPLVGDASLQVGLSTLADPDSEQDLRFRDIYYLNRFESDGNDRWFPTRDIDYKVNITGNSFHNVLDEGYEEGFVTGAFAGADHEHMGGTLKRSDMVGSFGGTRE